MTSKPVQRIKRRVDIKKILCNPIQRKRLLDGAADFICRVERIRR